MDTTTLEYSEIKLLKENIELLHETEHIEILKILIKNNERFTENKNGIFINTSKIGNETLLCIYKFVQYCLSNSNLLEQNSIYDKKFTDKIDIIFDYTNSTTQNDNNNNDNDDNDIIIHNNYNIFKSQLNHAQSLLYEKSIEPILDIINKKKNIRITNLKKKKKDIDYAYTNELNSEEYIL